MKDLRFMKEDYISKLLVYLPKGRKFFEIGAGYGNFTVKLAEISQRVRAFETNKVLYKILLKKASKLKNVEVYNEDAFKHKPEPDEIVFTDLPFSKSRKFLIWLVENTINEVYAIVQAEFFSKIAAKPSDRSYSGLSVIFNHFFEYRKLLDVPSEAYVPKPKVHATFFYAKRIRDCALGKDKISLVLKRMTKRFEKSRIDPSRKVFELSPEEVMREVGIQTC